MNRVFLVDVDNTLIDTIKLKTAIEQRYLTKFPYSTIRDLWRIYQEVLQEKGFVDVKEIALRLSIKLKTDDIKTLEEVYTKSPFRDCLYPMAVELLNHLKQKGKVVIYSWGDNFFQPLKITNSGIEEIVGKENVIVINNKEAYLHDLIPKLKTDGYDEITIIDDKTSVLEECYKIDPQIVCIWIRQGELKNDLPTNTSSISYEAHSLEDVIGYNK